MDYDNLKTDELVVLVTEIGVPLPTYNYNYGKYISEVPENLTFVSGVRGIEVNEKHDTFRDACIKIVKWNSTK